MSTLYIVATPIGNLSDASGRSIEVLGAVDGILAEDTRRTRKLLDRYDLRTSLTSLHGHNETSRIPRVVTRLDAGESLALVSDAGTPLLSDPGERLVRAVLDAGHTVTPVPGPSAILSALMGAGFATVPFIFHGFVPRKGKPRQVMLEQIASAPETSVVFESPERVATLLRALVALVADDRQVVVAREMTKIHEEFFRGTMAEAARYYAENKARGEVTVVVSPRSPAEGMAEGRESVDEVAARALARALVDAGHCQTVQDAFDRWLADGGAAYVARRGASPSDVVRLVARAGGVSALAHPGLLGRDELVPSLAKAGLGAIEVYHSEHDSATEAHYNRLAEQHGLAVCGGSDYHGDDHHRAKRLGRVALPRDKFMSLLQLLLHAHSVVHGESTPS